jgi:hypothetical protein
VVEVVLVATLVMVGMVVQTVHQVVTVLEAPQEVVVEA